MSKAAPKKTPLAESLATATAPVADVPAEGQQPTHIAVPVGLAEAIVQYLARQPYADVAPLIGALQQSSPLTVSN